MVNQQTPAAPITNATVLGGAAGTDSLNFQVGDSITVDGTVINIVAGAAGSATSPDVAIGDSVGTLLGRIGAITGEAPTITGGAITLHTGTTATLAITSTGTSFPQLGFTSAVTLNRTPSLAAGTGTVIANDQQTFLNESISGGALTAYDSTGTAVNLQLRWAKTDSAALGGSHTNTWSLFYQPIPARRAPMSPGSMPEPISPSVRPAPWSVQPRPPSPSPTSRSATSSSATCSSTSAPAP